MGLTPPKLDDRTYLELRNELIRRIPVHAPEWTDHNAGDPGIALLELFAWLAENLLYRMNRVPERAQWEFLRLLNLPLRPASLARTLAQLSLPDRDTEPVGVPFGGIRQVTLLASGDIGFSIQDEVTVLPVETLPVVKQEVENSDEILGQGGVEQLILDQLEESWANVEDNADKEQGQPKIEVRPYRTLPLPALEVGAQPPPTALEDTVDQILWIALLAPKSGVKGLKGPALLEQVKALRLRLSGEVISLGVSVDDVLCGPQDHMGCPESRGHHPRLPLVWEVATGRFRSGKHALDRFLYQGLALEKDDTAGLQQSGVVRLRLPDKQGAEPGLGTWSVDDSEYGLADPDLMGIGDLPPRLDDPDLESRVLTWLRCYRPQAAGTERYPDPRIRHIGANMVEVEQAVAAPRELLGSGNGRAGQIVKLAHTPVLPKTVQLQVHEIQGWVNWRQADDLAVAGPNDPFYELDPAAGEIRFGDGVHGRMPRPGEVIRCVGYRYGGGARGNVAAGAIARIKSTESKIARLKVSNPFPAAYGRDAETEAEALRRIPQALRHRNRAVAKEDFQDLALATPAVHIGRVEVLPRHKPHERVDGVPGVVTLVVLPAYDAMHPNEPTPDREMLRRVCTHMESHRLVTTELYVTAPEYVPLWTSVAIEVHPGFGPETVRRWVELAVRQYLAPLPPYGPEGKGWPMGRNVRVPDIAAAVLRVEGVKLVNDVKLLGPETEPVEAGMESGEVVLERWQLPVTRAVVLTTEAPNAPDIDRETGQSAVDDRPPLEPLEAPSTDSHEGEGEGEGSSPKPPPIVIPAPVEREEC